MKKLIINNGLDPLTLRKNFKETLLTLIMAFSFFQSHAAPNYSSDTSNKVDDIIEFQTSFQVSGTITDPSGQPLPGASVIEKGKSNGTTTDFDGNYSINVSDENAILLISYLGYIDQEIPVKGKAIIDVPMQENLSELDEVVVVGFGTRKKESVVGSITQAKGEELIQAGSVTTVSEALTGIMPGVSTQQAAGQPGSTAASILIRGASTFTGTNSPLFMVDGVERDFNNLDPNEIESISVLKDASATAVFGVKGANGVVLVTTKRGKKGETKINVSSSFGLKEPTIDTNYYADYATSLRYFNQAALNDFAYDQLKPQSLIDIWDDPNRDKTIYSYTTWIEEFLTTGVNSQHNLNISGGNDFVTYFTSLGFQYDGDIFDLEKQPEFDPRTFQRKFNWRSNLDFNFSKSTVFKVGLAGNFTFFNGNSLSGNTLNNSGVATPNGGGDLGRMFQTPMAGPIPILPDGRLTTIAGSTVNPNFYRIERQGQWNRRGNTMFTDFTLVQDITKTFKASAKVSYNYTQNYASRIQKQPLIYWYINPTSGEPGEPDFLQEGDPNAVDPLLNVTNESRTGFNNSLYYEIRFNYDESFGDGDHNVTALALFNRRRFQNQGTYIFPKLEESWVGSLTYNYQQKYLFEFNGAYTGNENWAPGLRFGFFPSAAIGWVVTRENFINQDSNFLNFLKFRYSYGEVGNENIQDRFQYISPFIVENRGNASSFLGDPLNNLAPFFIEGFPANAENTWETAIKQDLAMEFALLNNQLRGQVELFDERRTGILTQRNTVVPWFGNQAPYANIGETKNHGVDIELKWNSNIGKDFTYFFRGNLSLSESRIVAQDDPPQTPIQQRNAGKPIGWTPGLINDGIFQSWDDVYNAPVSSFNASGLRPGALSFVDYNGDGQITVLDEVPIGNPRFQTKSFAFSFGFTYKNFSAHALFNGAWDISKPLDRLYLFEYEGATVDSFQLLNNEQLDPWSPTNTDAVRPALSISGNNHDSEFSSFQYRSATFLRFKTFEVKYRIPKNILDKINVFNTFEVFANGNNLATWTDLPANFDPEQQQLRVYPITKRYNLGVRLSF